MNKAFIAAVAAAIMSFSVSAPSMVASAGAGEMKQVAGPDWVGCSSKEDYQSLIRMAFSEDEDAFADMVTSGKCFALKDGAPVAVVDETDSSQGIIAIQGEGSRGPVWTASDAIR